MNDTQLLRVLTLVMQTLNMMEDPNNVDDNEELCDQFGLLLVALLEESDRRIDDSDLDEVAHLTKVALSLLEQGDIAGVQRFLSDKPVGLLS